MRVRVKIVSEKIMVFLGKSYSPVLPNFCLECYGGGVSYKVKLSGCANLDMGAG